MCGIYGMVSLSGLPLQHPQIAPCMANTLRHRGPDGAGAWENTRAIVGATRLRIIDRRASSDQPFVGPDGTVVVCNGEIYNTGEIRNRFPAYRYLTKTDVEPLVPLFENENTNELTILDGMFAIAAWHDDDRTLRLVRDRAGEKPLFYCEMDDEIWFASEIQALRLHPKMQGGFDPAAMADYLALGYVREPRTLHPTIRKVPAGTVIEFTPGKSVSRSIDSPEHDTGFPLPTGPDRLRSVLHTAVAKQLHADVPVGLFLSGGLDSSLVTAFATQINPGIRSFTVRFKDSGYDEGLFAREVAAHFGTRHHEVLVGPKKLLEAFNTATTKIAEPISDPAILPTILLSQTAREYVGVVLAGEGSDEIFGGYPTYLGHAWADRVAKLPTWLINVMRSALASGAASNERVPIPMLLDRFLQYAREDVTRRHAQWFGTGLLRWLPPTLQTQVLEPTPRAADPVAVAMQLDFSGYLRELLLPKLDRASMLSSLETRAPFLDKDVVRYAKALPTVQKVAGTKLKIALAEAAAGLLPKWVISRRKRGLSVPIGSWINDGLRPTVDRLLDPERIANQTYMPDLPVGRLLAEHRRGQANHSRALWAIIVLQQWLEHWEGN